VGDGTSTATILAQAIFADGLRNVVAGASAIDIRRGLDMGLRAATEALRKLSRPVRTRAEKAQVATIAAHNDLSIGKLVAEAPGFGDRRRAMLEDIAVLTGRQLVSEELGIKFENVQLDLLGRANRVVCTREATTIVTGAKTDTGSTPPATPM
jgi:chaperonin GroEL (HSP60 family)